MGSAQGVTLGPPLLSGARGETSGGRPDGRLLAKGTHAGTGSLPDPTCPPPKALGARGAPACKPERLPRALRSKTVQLTSAKRAAAPAIAPGPPPGPPPPGPPVNAAGPAPPPRTTLSRGEPAGSEHEGRSPLAPRPPPRQSEGRPVGRGRRGGRRLGRAAGRRAGAGGRRRGAFRLPSSAARGRRAGPRGGHGGGGPAAGRLGAVGAAARGARAAGSRAGPGSGAAQRHGRTLRGGGLGHPGGLRRPQLRQADGPLRAAGKSVPAGPRSSPLPSRVPAPRAGPHTPGAAGRPPRSPGPGLPAPAPSPLLSGILDSWPAPPPSPAPQGPARPPHGVCAAPQSPGNTPVFFPRSPRLPPLHLLLPVESPAPQSPSWFPGVSGATFPARPPRSFRSALPHPHPHPCIPSVGRKRRISTAASPRPSLPLPGPHSSPLPVSGSQPCRELRCPPSALNSPQLPRVSCKDPDRG